MDFYSNFRNISSDLQVARICKVSLRTAQRWTSNKTKTPRGYMELLHLHDTGRVMPHQWSTYCQFTGEYLDFGFKRALSHQELGWYWYSVNLWRSTMDLLPQIEARLDALMKVCPPAEVINLQAYKDEIERFKKRPFYKPDDVRETAYELAPKLISRSHGC